MISPSIRFLLNVIMVCWRMKIARTIFFFCFVAAIAALRLSAIKFLSAFGQSSLDTYSHEIIKRTYFHFNCNFIQWNSTSFWHNSPLFTLAVLYHLSAAIVLIVSPIVLWSMNDSDVYLFIYYSLQVFFFFAISASIFCAMQCLSSARECCEWMNMRREKKKQRRQLSRRVMCQGNRAFQLNR